MEHSLPIYLTSNYRFIGEASQRADARDSEVEHDRAADERCELLHLEVAERRLFHLVGPVTRELCAKVQASE